MLMELRTFIHKDCCINTMRRVCLCHSQSVELWCWCQLQGSISCCASLQSETVQWATPKHFTTINQTDNESSWIKKKKTTHTYIVLFRRVSHKVLMRKSWNHFNSKWPSEKLAQARTCRFLYFLFWWWWWKAPALMLMLTEQLRKNK